MFLLLTVSCKNEPGTKEANQPIFSTYGSTAKEKNTGSVKNEIYYGLLTPVEVCEIFNRLGVVYSRSILNPAGLKDQYLSISKTSLNTGVYGVDLGYLMLFGAGQEGINYTIAIHSLANKLGIPDSFLSDLASHLETNISDADTVISIMNKAYYKIEDHLRTGGRESCAGLIVMGGWIEAMYIATNLVYNPEKPDSQVVQKIAQQKYTLNTLLSFLKNYYDDPMVVYYTKKLKYLKHYFDTFDIYFRKGDLEIDTTKQVFRSSGSEMTVTVETLNKIRDYVNQLRTEIVTP